MTRPLYILIAGATLTAGIIALIGLWQANVFSTNECLFDESFFDGVTQDCTDVVNIASSPVETSIQTTLHNGELGRVHTLRSPVAFDAGLVTTVRAACTDREGSGFITIGRIMDWNSERIRLTNDYTANSCEDVATSFAVTTSTIVLASHNVSGVNLLATPVRFATVQQISPGRDQIEITASGDAFSNVELATQGEFDAFITDKGATPAQVNAYIAGELAELPTIATQEQFDNADRTTAATPAQLWDLLQHTFDTLPRIATQEEFDAGIETAAASPLQVQTYVDAVEDRNVLATQEQFDAGVETAAATPLQVQTYVDDTFANNPELATQQEFDDGAADVAATPAQVSAALDALGRSVAFTWTAAWTGTLDATGERTGHIENLFTVPFVEIVVSNTGESPTRRGTFHHSSNERVPGVRYQSRVWNGGDWYRLQYEFQVDAANADHGRVMISTRNAGAITAVNIGTIGVTE